MMLLSVMVSAYGQVQIEVPFARPRFPSAWGSDARPVRAGTTFLKRSEHTVASVGVHGLFLSEEECSFSVFLTGCRVDDGSGVAR